jgi:hypothetical protein
VGKPKQVEWRQETAEERAEFETWRQTRRAKKPHCFDWKVLNWWACGRCGLLRFRNAATKAAISAGCEE